MRKFLTVGVVSAVAIAAGLGLAVAVAAVTSITITGNNLNCKQGTSSVSATGGTSTLPDGQSITCSASSNPPTVLLGDQNVETSSDSSSAPASEAFGYTASADGTATRANVYLSSTDGATVGLYADNSGKPGALLDKGSVSTNTAGWTAIPLSGGVTIANGTRYWIAVGANTGGSVTYRDHGSSGSNLDFSGTGFANPYTSNGQWNSNPISAYVSGTASTGTGTTTTTPPPTTTTTTTPPPPPAPTGLHVVGSHLADANGNVVKLHGVNGSSTDYACYRSPGTVTDGSIQFTQATIDRMLSDHVNAVRVVLNEDCWLGINGLPTNGLDYRTPIINWVNLLSQNGMFVIVDLHENAPGSNPSRNQNNMADEDHAPAFWQSVASTFKDHQNVIFDLYNEPHDISWPCWRDGCALSSWQDGASGSRVAGMQQLVDTVRATGAGNVLMLGCIDWSNDCSDSGGSWLQYKPSDPDNNLAASVHLYETNACSSASCFTATWAPIIQAGYPLVLGEWGDYTPSGGSPNQSFAQMVLDWLDQNGAAGETTWTWNNWAGTAMALIAASDGSSLTSWGSYITGQYAQRYP